MTDQDLGNGKYGAPKAEGFYDDPVMGSMIALEGIRKNGGSVEDTTQRVILGDMRPSLTGKLAPANGSELGYGIVSVGDQERFIGRGVDLVGHNMVLSPPEDNL